MATARNRNVKVSPPVEEKVVETPQVEEVKEAPKPVEVKPVEAPKTSKKIQKGSKVLTPFGNVSIVYEIENDFCFVRKQENRKKLYKIHIDSLELSK